MHVGRVLLRIATVAGITGGLLFLLLLVVSIAAISVSGGRGRGGQSIDHEPIAFEEATRLMTAGKFTS